jgi:endonuclease/exonuclease/phosphatase family metal-dependent hydrolase
MSNQENPLTLTTYNIHRCIGGDGKKDPKRIATVLKQLDTDIIALQEVESTPDDSLDLLHYLSAETGFYAIVGPTVSQGRSRYGNAVLTRLDIEQVEGVDLSVPDREPRGALSTILRVKNRRLHLLATHLGLGPGERRTQVQFLLKALEHKNADISVLLGDLNEWFLWGRPLRWLHRHFSSTPAPASFPARFPVFALDRIWVQPREKLLEVRPVATPQTRIASDHLPVTAKLIF